MIITGTLPPKFEAKLEGQSFHAREEHGQSVKMDYIFLKNGF